MTTTQIRAAIKPALASRIGKGERVKVRINVEPSGALALHPAGEDDWSGEETTLAAALRLVTPETRSMHVDVYTRNGLPAGGGDELDRGYYVRISDDGAVSVGADY